MSNKIILSAVVCLVGWIVIACGTTLPNGGSITIDGWNPKTGVGTLTIFAEGVSVAVIHAKGYEDSKEQVLAKHLEFLEEGKIVAALAAVETLDLILKYKDKSDNRASNNTKVKAV